MSWEYQGDSSSYRNPRALGEEGGAGQTQREVCGHSEMFEGDQN